MLRGPGVYNGIIGGMVDFHLPPTDHRRRFGCLSGSSIRATWRRYPLSFLGSFDMRGLPWSNIGCLPARTR
jgi:hypothetical protein